MDELRFGEDTRIAAHQGTEESFLEGRFVDVVEVFLVKQDTYARLEILFVVVGDISRRGEQLQGSVGGEERQVHIRAELLDIEGERGVPA